MTSSPNRPERHDRTGDAWTSDGPVHVSAVSHLGAVTTYQLLARLKYLCRKSYETHLDTLRQLGADGNFIADFRFWSATALGKSVPFHECDRRQLYAVCRALLSEIESDSPSIPRPATEHLDWFPHGWEDAAALVRGEIKRKADREMGDDERWQLLRKQVDEMRRRAG